MFDSNLFAVALKKVGHKYLLANLVTMRVRQLAHGAEPLVEAEGMTAIDIALKEITEGMIEMRAPETTTSEDLFA